MLNKTEHVKGKLCNSETWLIQISYRHTCCSNSLRRPWPYPYHKTLCNSKTWLIQIYYRHMLQQFLTTTMTLPVSYCTV